MVLYGVTYMDRLLISAAMPQIRKEFGFDTITVGWIFAAFTWVYALGQIPGGWVADRFGPRRVLSALVIWWSVFTAATAAVWNAGSMYVARALFGLGEAGAFPAATSASSRWLPPSERGFVQGAKHSGSRLAGGLTPPIVVMLMVFMDWRMVFVLFGAIGCTWAFAWLVLFRDDPARHPSVTAEELNEIGSTLPKKAAHVPWRVLLTNPNMLLICAMYFAYVYSFWIYLNWFPTYLVESRGLTFMQSGFFSSLPLLAGAVTNTLGGVWSDRIFRRTGDLKYARRVVPIVGFSIGVVSMAIGALTDSTAGSIIFLTLAAAGLELTTGVSWAIVIDVGQEHAGTVSGLMNMSGNIGGALSPIVFAWLVQSVGSWAAPFVVASVLCSLAAVLWLKIDPTSRIVEKRAVTELSYAD
ncbi:MAG: MFS transporter [Acidobacteria bacterium]|nr:MFS transporter [Acidobacteriota bacterium]